jgi:hypothetical protein
VIPLNDAASMLMSVRAETRYTRNGDSNLRPAVMRRGEKSGACDHDSFALISSCGAKKSR